MEATIESLTGATAAAASPAASASAATGPEVLGRDEFLQLLVTKLENQDPLNPAEDTEFVAQLATFSSLEQLINMNDSLETISVGQTQLLDAQTLTLIGKEALVTAGQELRVIGGKADELVYQLPKPAEAVTLRIYDGAQLVDTVELDPSSLGRESFVWDGVGEDADGNEIELGDGSYRFEVQATDAEDQPMSIALFQSIPIEAVSFLDGLITLISDGTEIPFDSVLEIRQGR